MQISLMRLALLGGTAAATALLLSGCGALHPEDFPLDGPTQSASTGQGNVTKEDFGSTWPLEVDSGNVACETNDAGDVALTFTTTEGKVYALNGIAEEKHPPISEIATGSLGGLIGQAFTTCDE